MSVGQSTSLLDPGDGTSEEEGLLLWPVALPLPQPRQCFFTEIPGILAGFLVLVESFSFRGVASFAALCA